MATGAQFLDLDCAVTLRLREVTIWRRVCVRRRYGVTFVSNYKPFDQLTFAIVRSGFLPAYPGALRQLRQTMAQVAAVGVFLQTLEVLLAGGAYGGRVVAQPVFLTVGEAPAMPGPVQAALDEALAEIRRTDPGIDDRMAQMPPEEESWFRWKLVMGDPSTVINRPAPFSPEPLEVEWPEPPTGELLTDVPTDDSVIFSVDSTVNLEDYDYEKRLVATVEPHLEEIREAAKVYNEALVELLGTSEDPISGGEVAGLEAGARSAGARLAPALAKAVEGFNAVTVHVNAHTRAGFTSDVLRSYVTQSSRRLRNLAYHVETADDLRKLRDELPAYNGHVNANGHDRLTLALDGWKGMTIFSGPYYQPSVPITLERLTLNDKEKDLAIVHFANLHLCSDQLDAAIFAADRLYFEGEPRIFGQLIINRLRLRSDRGPGEDLKGSVTYNPRCYSGEYWKRPTATAAAAAAASSASPTPLPVDPSKVSFPHYTVGMSPRDLNRVIFRSPDAAGQPVSEEVRE